MPQIIKHRRGPIGTLKAITPYKGEVVFTFCAEPTGNSANDLLNQYPGSPEQSYDSSCKTMHDLVKVALLNRK